MFIKFDRFILILIYYISPSTFLFLFVYDLNTLYYLVALSKNEKHNYINFGKTTTIMIFETNKNLGTKLFKKKKKTLNELLSLFRANNVILRNYKELLK